MNTKEKTEKDTKASEAVETDSNAVQGDESTGQESSNPKMPYDVAYCPCKN